MITMETKIYNQAGKEMGSLSLPESIFGLKWNADLVHQVVVSMQSSARNPIAHTKTRGEVRGGGKKPWKQKGTGQARHGSRRSPIWVGGGVAHGPRNDKNFDRKVNRKMKAKALYTILSRKWKEGEISFVDDLKLSEVKTKSALGTLGTLSEIAPAGKALQKKKNGLCIVMPERNADTWRSFRNLGHVSLEETRSINPVSLMTYKHIVFVYPEETLRILGSKLSVADSAVEKKETKEKKPRVASKKKVVAKA
jgi:large subunit ribosomal protein L4